MADLTEELKTLIIDALHLEDVKPADIDPAAPLFTEGLGLDSIDALELGVALQKKYGMRFDSNAEETKKHFASVNALSAFVAANRKQE
jgi:acyl carrier protein